MEMAIAMAIRTEQQDKICINNKSYVNLIHAFSFWTRKIHDGWRAIFTHLNVVDGHNQSAI